MDEKNTASDNSEMDLTEALAKQFIREEDLTAERLTELFRHKRVHQVEDTDEGFEFIFRDGKSITVTPSAGGDISGPIGNKYLWDTVRGSADTEGLSHENILEQGDLVRLKEPYEKSGEYIEYTHGVVVDILGGCGGELRGVPNRVALHLYNPQTREMYFDAGNRRGSPVIVDQHVRNLVLIQKASDGRYNIRDIDIAEYVGLGDQW